MKHSHPFLLILVASLLVLTGGGIVPGQVSKMEVEIFPLGLADFETSEQIAKSIVSQDGKLVADKKGNRLIVLDYASNRDALRQALLRAPAPSANVKITISMKEESSGQAAVIALEGNQKGGKAQDLSDRMDSFLEQELTVQSGGRGHFRVGTSLPFMDWIYQYGVKQAFWSPRIVWKEAGGQILVEPYVMPGRQVRLRFTPEISYVTDSERTTYSAEPLMIETMISDGEKVELGQVAGNFQDFYSKFLTTHNRMGERTLLHVILTATIEDLPPASIPSTENPPQPPKTND